MKKREKYFKTTSCRDKRSIVRSLNTFSKKFEYITCEKKEIDLDLEPMSLCYLDKEEELFLSFLRNESKTNLEKKANKNIVFSKIEADIDLKNTQLILETIDNLISINRKQDLKNKLKELVNLKDLNNLNSFFVNEHSSIEFIKDIIEDEKFAIRIFNQIKNRIQFSRTGIYTTNDSHSTVKNRIKINPTTFRQIQLKEFEYVIDNLWLLEDSVKEDLEKKNERFKEVSKIVKEESQNIYNNNEIVDMEKNSSLFLPLDGDEDSNSSMPLEFLLKEKFGMYDEEVYKDYYSYDYEYEEFIDQAEELKILIEQYIIDYYNYTNKSLEIEKFIKAKIERDDEKGFNRFLNYINESIYRRKLRRSKILFKCYPDFYLLHKYLVYDLENYEKILKIEEYKEEFLKLYPYLKFIKFYDISYEDYQRFIRFENEFYTTHSLNIEKMDLEWVETIINTKYYGHYNYISEEEQYFVLSEFDRNNKLYNKFKKIPF